MDSADPAPPTFIARQLALGFGTVSLVSVAMCAILLITISDVAGLVSGMRHDEVSIRQGLELSTSVREQSLHIAHTAIAGDPSHLEDYRKWRSLTRTRIQELAASIPESESWRLELLAETTQKLHDEFTTGLLPAVQRGDEREVRRVHTELEDLGERAAQHADVLARAVESKMTHAHVEATGTTRQGLLFGIACIVLILILSAGFTLRLRAAVVKPIGRLTEAARRFGRGDFKTRVGNVGKGEIEEFSHAFDTMAEELMKREAQLLQQERMAAIGQLAAGVAHELNNPIGIIRGYLKTMSPEDGTETLRDELAIIDEEAAQCQRIAEDLLSYARISELDNESLSVSEFLREALERFRESPLIGKSVVHLEAEDADIRGDRTRLRQVVFNLVANACQASTGKLPIELTGLVDGAHYQLQVLDDGPGVPTPDRQRIFEPFFSKRRGGSGLGLAVVQGIIKAHGGTIEVTGGSHGGALFRVRLPLALKASADENHS